MFGCYYFAQLPFATPLTIIHVVPPVPPVPPTPGRRDRGNSSGTGEERHYENRLWKYQQAEERQMEERDSEDLQTILAMWRSLS
jgi:hypothetical protein